MLLLPVILMIISIILISIILILPIILLYKFIYSKTQDLSFSEKIINNLYEKISNNDSDEESLENKISFLINNLGANHYISKEQIQNFINECIENRDRNKNNSYIKNIFLKILFYILIIPFLIPLLLISPLIITLYFSIKSFESESIENHSKTKIDGIDSDKSKIIESYLTLGFSTFEETQNKENISKNYKILSQIFHPDKNFNEKEKYEKLFKDIDFAKRTMEDENQKQYKMKFLAEEFNKVKEEFDKIKEYQNINNKKYNIFESAVKISNQKKSQDNSNHSNQSIPTQQTMEQNSFSKVESLSENDFRFLTKLFKDQKTSMQIKDKTLYINRDLSENEKELFKNFGITEVKLSNDLRMNNNNKNNLLQFLKKESSDELKNRLEFDINTEEVNWKKMIKIDFSSSNEQQFQERTT
jgi:hypothetical protein